MHILYNKLHTLVLKQQMKRYEKKTKTNLDINNKFTLTLTFVLNDNNIHSHFVSKIKLFINTDWRTPSQCYVVP